MIDKPRVLLRSLFDAAVAAADPACVLAQYLPAPPKGRTIVIGAGKAAAVRRPTAIMLRTDALVREREKDASLDMSPPLHALGGVVFNHFLNRCTATLHQFLQTAALEAMF